MVDLVTVACELLVICPTRGRPGNARRLAQAAASTSTAATRLVFAVDDDDPELPGYSDVPRSWAEVTRPRVDMLMCGLWQPMAAKLNAAAVAAAAVDPPPFALGFLGDDHLPRTHGWDSIMLGALRELGTGIVYGDDRIRGEALASAWVMTTDIVRALGAMVPAPVDHLYCDNAIMRLGAAAGCLRHLPGVVIQHLHPVAGTAPDDAGYRRVNSPDQYRRDGARYVGWAMRTLPGQAAAVAALRGVRVP